MTATETVRDRIAIANAQFTPAQIAVGFGLVALIGTALLFAQQPMLHDSMHNFRHAAGVVCH